VHLRSIETL